MSETIADIVTVLRRQSDSDRVSATQLRRTDDDVDFAIAFFHDEEAKYLLQIADRLEAAAKRERAITDVMLAVKDKPLPHHDPEHAPPMQPGNAAAKWLYRLEYHDGTCGLWYDGSGNWCFERGIGSLDDSCKTKSLPMDYDERYRQDGRSWFSSCSRKEDLLHWYSREDAKRLLSNGFVFTRYLATEYREYDQQTVFIKDTCLCREEIDFESLWKSSAPGDAAAMREALFAVKKSIDGIGASSLDCDPEILMASLTQVCARLSARIDAALSAPPRNCYRFETHNEAKAAFLHSYFGPTEPEFVEDAFARWLFAPAKENGGNKQ